jgi:hypothetical protein
MRMIAFYPDYAVPHRFTSYNACRRLHFYQVGFLWQQQLRPPPHQPLHRHWHHQCYSVEGGHHTHSSPR